MATKPKVGEIQAKKPRFELVEGDPSQFEMVNFYSPAPSTAAEQEAPERSMLRAAGDLGLSLGQGAIGSVKSLTDLAGADNAASETLGSMSKFLGDQKSDQSKATLKASQERVKAAEESGSTWEEAKAYMGMLLDQPGEFLAQGVGSFATLGLGKIAQAAKLASAAKAAGVSKEAFLASKAGMEAIKEAAKFGFKANVGIGAAQGVGAVKGSQYEQTYNNAIAQGVPEDQAQALATEAQRYGGSGTMQQLLGGGLGALAASTGPIERLVAGRAGREAGMGTMAAMGKGFLVEGSTEGLQGGQERFAGNTAAIDAGVLDPSKRMQGVGGQMAMEGTIGGVIGGAAGPFEAQAPINLPNQAKEAVQPPQPLPETGPMTRAVNAALQKTAPLPAPVLDESALRANGVFPPPVLDDAAIRAGILSGDELRQFDARQSNAAMQAQQAPQVDAANEEPADETIAQPIANTELQAALRKAESDGIDTEAVLERAAINTQAGSDADYEREVLALIAQARIQADMRPEAAVPPVPPVPDVGVAEPLAQPLAQPLASDILNPKGSPFKTRKTAELAAKKTPGDIVQVDGGFVVRPQESTLANTKAQNAAIPEAIDFSPAQEAGAGRRADEAAGSSSVDARRDESFPADEPAAADTTGEPALQRPVARSDAGALNPGQTPRTPVDEPRSNADNPGQSPSATPVNLPLQPRSTGQGTPANVQDAPQATTGAPATTGAATTEAEAPTKTRQKPDIGAPAVEAPAPARGDGAAAAGVPDAGAGAGVRADGLNADVPEAAFGDMTPDLSKNPQELNTSAEPAQKTAESEQVKPFEHAGLKVQPSRVKEGDQVVDRWVVQSPENAEREARGERQIGGDRIVETREQAIKTAEQEVKRYAKEKADRAEIDAQDKARRDADEAKKEANRGKTLLERRADAILDKPGKFPASAGLGLGTKREAMDKAIEQGRLVTEVMVDDTAAKKRDQDAVDAVRIAGYILGASNENIPVVKRGLEAQARLKEGKYQKPEYRVYQGSDRNGSFFEITKTEYDYVQKVKANPPAESKPDQETKAKAEPKAENLPEGWDTLKNGYTGLPVYRFNQGAGQPFAVVTRTEIGYEVQIRHGDKLVTSRNMRGYATGEALDIATQMLGEATMATHKDPGEKAEPATKAVVNEAMKTAAKNEDTKPSEMRKWLLGEIDKALLQAPDRADYDEAVKRMGEKDAVSMFTGNGFLGKNAETGFVTFDVPGDGKFKVRNSTRGLLEFRKNVSASLGFKDSGQKTVKPEQNEGVRNGSGGQMAAITNMIEEGDFEAARDYAEAVGVKLEDVKVPRGERKPQWDQFLKDGTVPPPPDTRPLPPQRTPAQIAEDERLAKEAEAKKPKDTGWNMAGTGYGGKRYRGRNITTADGREIVARVYENAGNYDEVEVKVDGVRKFTVRDSYNAQDKADAFVKTLIEREQEADGPAAQQDAPAGRTYLAVPFKDKDYAKRAGAKWDDDKKLWYADPVGGDGLASGEININLQQFIPNDYTTDDRFNYYSDKAVADAVALNASARDGVEYEVKKRKHPDGMMLWSAVKAGEQSQADSPAIPEGYKPAGEPFYRGGRLTQGYAPFAPGERVTMKEAAGQSGVVESLASADESGVFSSAVVKFDNGVEQMVPLGKLQAAVEPAQTQATGTRRDPAKVSMFNPYEDGDIVTIDGQDWTVKQDTPGWYLTNTGNWRGTHPTIRNIKAMADLIRAVEQAAVAQPKTASSTGLQAYMAASAEVTRLETALIDLRSDIRVKPKDRAEWLRKIGGIEREIAKAKVERDRLGKELREGNAAEPEAETPRLTPAEAAELMEWQSLGTKDGVTKHILTFYESKANKDAKRGRMIVATVTKGDRSATAWMVDGDDQTFGPLSLAKKRGMEIGMAKAVSDGFVDSTKPAAPAQQEAQQATDDRAKPESVAPAAAKVDDFGEKLPPARRTMAAKLSEELTDDAIASQPLSKVWPLEENEAIEDTFAAAVAHVMREAVPAKPRTSYKVKSWVSKVKVLRDFAAKVMRGAVTKEKLIGEMEKVYSLRDLASKIKLLEQIDREQWKRIGDVSEAPGAIQYVDGKAVPQPSASVTVDGRSHWFRNSGDINDHLDAIKSMLTGDAPESKLKFEVFRATTGDRKVFISKKGDKEYRRLMEFDTAEEARKALKDQYADLVAAWEGVKSRDNITERDLRTAVNRPRTGKDHRKGRDISAEEFQKTFGFRGGEFGKWVSQGNGAQERQFMLNSAYDALMDLSDIIGVPPKAISLDGTLGVAFGSRGGGWASAHFEPSNLVINLTKPRGAGALAHEWFHALDNYFARKRGGEVPIGRSLDAQNEYRRNNFITHKTRPMMVRKDGKGSPVTRERLAEWRKSSPGSAYLNEDQWIEDPNHKPGVRAEVEERFDELVKALDASPMLKRARKIDGVKLGDGYWSRTLERAARAFENYIQMRMNEQGYHNDFLVNVKPAVDVGKNLDRYPYLLPSEVAPIADAFSNLFNTIQTKEEDGKTVMFSRRSASGNRVPDVVIGHKLGDLNRHPDYDAAKAGDSLAAARIATDLVDDAFVQRVRNAAGGADVIVPVVSVEATGRNKIPAAVADLLAEKLGSEAEADIVQANSPKRTAMDGLDRLLNPPVFEGPVRKGATYVLVDDTVTQGGTFASLASHIRDNGGRVAGLVALTGKQYSSKLSPSSELLNQVRERFDDIEPQFRAATGYGFDALTESEARYLVKHDDAQRVRDRIIAAGNQAGNEGDAGVSPRASRSQSATGSLSQKTAQQVVDAIRSRWANAPEVVVVSGMQDQAVPQRVRDADLEQRSMGATGEPEGFWYGGKVYIVAGALKSPRDVIRVLFHESLGHYGLQGVFGDGLKPILQQIAALRRAEVVAKAREYGLVRLNVDGSPSVDVDNATDKEVWAAMDEQHKLYAAEEVLAVMAQTKPEMGYVKRALAAIRAWLRKNVPGFQDMKLTDGEIIQQYILPARRFVESGPGGGPRGGQPVPALSRTQDQTQTTDNADIRFSRTSLSETYADLIPQQLQDRLADMTTSQRGFNRWWHGTVGTQLHKAKVNKEFGKVYYAVQDFMKDVSRMATLAADKAPDLLPQIDSLDDVKKVLPQMGIAGHRQRKADMKAASDALFDGTLRYTRDGYGQPVEAENETDAGIVWTDEELRDRGLNDEAIKLYRQARSAINQSLDNLMAADVYRMLTAANPESLADNPQEHAVLMAKIRKAAASDRPLKVLELAGVALDRQAEVLRKQVASLKKQMDEAYIDGMNEAYTQAKDALKTIEGLKERMEDKYERVSTLKSNGYAPLMRFGRYAVDVLDEDGNRAFFGLYETQYAANRAARRFAEQGFRVSQSVKSAKEFELLKGISPETAMLFAELLGVEKDEAMQKWLQNAVAEQSALKRQIRRKGIAGFDDDAGRVVAAFITSNARAASRALHALRIQERVENVRAGDVKDEAIKLAEYVNNPQEEAQAIRALLFFNYIGGSVASALVNLTQTVVQTFPYLAQFGGARKGASRVTAAMKLAIGKIEDAELAQAVKRAEQDGVIKPQEVFQLQAEASRTLGSNLYARTGLALWGSFFQMAEQFNRRVAFIAAYQTAKEEGMRNPFAFAENAVDETQGTFNKANRPNWGRGAIGATLFTFKTFTVQYVEFLKRLPPKERALALGVLVLLAGFRGLPFAEDAEDVVDTVAQSLGYNFTTKEQMDRFLVATLGKPFADFLQHGASGTGLLPFDVSQRLGMADLLPATGVLKPSETRKDEQILEVFGVAGGFVRDALKKTWTPTSVAELSNTAWAPVAIRNAAKAIEMYDRGIYTDSRGRKVMDVSPVDAAMKGIGLQPAGVAEESRKAGSVYEMRALFAKTKAEITEQMALGQFENDKAKIQKARDRLADWNAKNPEAQIVLSGQAVRRRVTEMRKDRADRLVRSTPRELRAQAAETME